VQSRAGVKNVTVIRDCNGQEPTIVRDNAHRVSTSRPQVFGLSVPMTAKVVAHEFPIDPWDTYTLRIPPHERHASRCPGADSQVTCELVHTQIDRAPLLVALSFISFSEGNVMVGKHELRRYLDSDEARRWANRNFVLGSIFAAAVLMMAVAGSTMAPKPSVGNGGVDISASQGHLDTPFSLMSRASANFPVESWEPAF
jgi:hypothetical protein